MSAFLKPAHSFQKIFVYKRPQAQISICSLQYRFLETSSPGACAERPVRLMDRHRHEKIIKHPSAVKDISKIPFGYAFIPSGDFAIAKICREMARKQNSKIFACVSTQTPEPPLDSHGQLPKSAKTGERPIFGLYVPSDIADAAMIQFKEQTKAFQGKRDLYINKHYPHMPYSHRERFNAKEYQALQRLKTNLAKCLKDARWTMEFRIERYIRNYIRKEECDLTEAEVKQVMASWKDGSEMRDVEIV